MPRSWRSLAFEWIEREDVRHATALLRAALDVGAPRPDEEERLLGTLLEVGLTELASSARSAALLRYAALARSAEARVERCARYAQAQLDEHRLSRSLSDSREIPDKALRLGVRAQLFALADQKADWDAALLELRLMEGHEEEALRHFISIYAVQNDNGREIATWGALAQVAPASRIEGLQRVATLQRRTGQAALARATEDELLAAAPRSAPVIRALAQCAGHAKEFDRARDLYLRLIALDPKDLVARFDLAVVLHALGDAQGALDEVCAALATDDEALRRRAREFMSRRLLRGDHPELRAEALRAEIERTSLTLERGLIWVDLLSARDEVQAAGEVLQRLAARFPRTGALEEALRTHLGATVASCDLPGARALLAGGPHESDLRAAVTLARGGNPASALRVLRDVDPVRASQVLLVEGAPDLAARALTRALRTNPDSAPLLRRLAVAYARAGDSPRAKAALERWLAALPADRSRARHAGLLELGDMHIAARSRSGQRDVGERLFAELQRSEALLNSPSTSVLALGAHTRRVAEIVAYHAQSGLDRDFVRSALAAPAEDLALTVALLARVDSLRPGERRDALARLTRRPYGAWTEADWQAAAAQRPRASGPSQGSSWGTLR
ncbi:MAG: tetratricopeptide repeat protein [Planctomycetota bacterium]